MDPNSAPNPYAASANFSPAPKPPEDDGTLTVVDWLLCIFCAGIGCIIGIVRLIQGKRSGVKMIGISILFAIIWNLVRFGIIAATNGN